MKRFLIDFVKCTGICLIGSFIGVMTVTQGQTAPELAPTPLQLTQLQLKQKDAIIASQKEQIIQASFQQAQAEYQQAVAALNAESEKVKKENKWADGVTFDANQLTFAAPPAPAPQPKPAVTAVPDSSPKK